MPKLVCVEDELGSKFYVNPNKICVISASKNTCRLYVDNSPEPWFVTLEQLEVILKHVEVK